MGYSDQPAGSDGVNSDRRLPDWNLLLALHRFFSMRLHLQRDSLAIGSLIKLADQGIYYDPEQPSLRCYFCDFHADVSQSNDHAKVEKLHGNHHCQISEANSKNVTIRDVNDKPNYRYEAHRLYSLVKKRVWLHPDPLDLAKSGFFYTGEGDNVKCEFCDLEIRGWEEGDSPDVEHKQWSPECPFLLEGQAAGNIVLGDETSKMLHDGVPQYPSSTEPFETDDIPRAEDNDEITASSG